ncbi:hypothetical protein AVEN_143376-1 [Araneus ventricosus]|uniref:Uncharacterized protein n=1 Tax=Araneus ventricosus TaxID=182803 RepID=A0A4Y2AEN7_ARAVE|nr:hypothetical protein AVEN_143376-1 [Araneus ventricosus]
MKRSKRNCDEPVQTRPEAQLLQGKIMPLIWWNFKGIICFQYVLLKTRVIKEKCPESANQLEIMFPMTTNHEHPSKKIIGIEMRNVVTSIMKPGCCDIKLSSCFR